MSYSRVLIAIDSSSTSLHAAKAGFELVKQLDCHAAIICVVDQTKEIGNVDAGILPQEVAILLKKEAQEAVHHAKEFYTGSLEVECFTPEGEPQEEILGAILSWEADLLVVGTHGRTGLKHMLMGSTAEHLIRHSVIPVMVVPMPKM